MKKQDMYSETSLEQLYNDFALYLKRKNLAHNTAAAYGTSIRFFFDSYPTLSIEHLKQFRTDLIAKYQPATVNQRIHGMNHFLLFLEQNHMDFCPEVCGFRLSALKLPRSSFQDRVISNEDCLLLQQKLKEEGHVFWYFVVRFLVTTGVRVSELTQIKVEHLNRGHLDLYSKGGKIRRIYITDALCSEALDWCAGNGKSSGFLFAQHSEHPITVRGIQFQLKHFAHRYGVDPNTVYPHSFRHRFAKNFLHRCGDIALLADLMGHESIETTRIYLTRSSKEQQLLLDEIVTW